MRIGGEKVLRLRMQIREIGAPPAGNQDLAANAVGMLEQRDAAPTFGRFRSAQQPGRSCAEGYDVEFVDWVGDGGEMVTEDRKKQLEPS